MRSHLIWIYPVCNFVFFNFLRKFLSLGSTVYLHGLALILVSGKAAVAHKRPHPLEGPRGVRGSVYSHLLGLYKHHWRSDNVYRQPRGLSAFDWETGNETHEKCNICV